MTTRITWSRSQDKMNAGAMIEYTLTTERDIADFMSHRAVGPWAVMRQGGQTVIRLEDPEDIRLIRKLFVPQDLPKREIPSKDWSARTMASNIATVPRAL